MKQLSLFDLLTPEPPKADTLEEFIIWYANMSGKGEHIYGRWQNGNIDFVPRKAIIDGEAESLVYTFTDAWEVSNEHHARIGKMVQTKRGYGIEEVWK